VKSELDEESTIRRYLLGLLTETERASVEERFFDDNEYFERVSSLEDDLIDEYARGMLSRKERMQFDKYCMSSAKVRQRIEFARTLDRKVHASSPARGRRRAPFGLSLAGMRFAFAALTIAAIAIGLAIWAPWRGPVTGPLPNVFAFVLRPGSTRDPGRENRQVIPPNATVIRIQAILDAGPSYSSYGASLRTVQGALVWTKDGLTAAAGRSVTIEVPAGVLNSDDYILTVAGVAADGRREDVADYSFRVIRDRRGP
jgi:hypothetical protein